MTPNVVRAAKKTLDEKIAFRKEPSLTAYQGARVGETLMGRDGWTEITDDPPEGGGQMALGYHKLLSYKDEYRGRAACLEIQPRAKVAEAFAR